ncbi:LacI family DNA-binding transcriptional regulator [Bacillaceae bacterium Marseille-Q3522]|nr:LacI family DNA-binding transcriptional regulator [Bacillaceae bacterium Marseille-Q3522]
MVSINDVAKRAKVAKSTVSLVINDSGYVSQKTREKVEQAMKELNYVPSQLAKNLSIRQSHIIGVVVPDIVHPFFSNFVKSIEKELYDRGYMTMVCSTLGREQVEEEYLNWLNRRTMDGIIMCAHTLAIEKYVNTKRPIVSLDRYLNNDIPVVSSDHRQAAELTVEALRKNKCHNVVQFVGSSNANVGSENYALTCKKLFEQKDGQVHFYKMQTNTFSLNEYLFAAQAAFKAFPGADAFVGSDMVITQCLKLALEKKLRIPEELKLIAYDGTQVTRIGYPKISAVFQPVDQLAFHAAEQIIAKIENRPTAKITKALPVSWLQGNTTY